MKTIHGILILLVLGILVPGSAALDLDEIIITTNHGWITAGTGTGIDETATITVVINNESFTNGSVTVDEVSFSCTNEFLYDEEGSKIGDLSPSIDTTSPYQASFHTKKSGNATINVIVKYTEVEDGPVLQMSNNTVQRVDHALPYAFEYLDYDTEITVNTDTNITLQMTDKYENVIDSRKEESVGGDAEGVRFLCSKDTDAGFWNGVNYSTKDLIKRVDSEGNLSATFKASTLAGENNVDLICVTAVPEMLISIYGVGESMPASMTTSVDPSTLSVPGNGVDDFTIIYELVDRFDNPSPNSPIFIHTSIAGEEMTVLTNEYGYAVLTYGPKTSIGRVLVSAETENSSVKDDIELRFTSSDGTWFEAYANPSDLASYEVKPFSNGTIFAQVTDDLGRGVENQLISFEINASSIKNNTRIEEYPKIYDPMTGSWGNSTTSIITDEDGYATVHFKAGEFPDKTSPYFNPYSRGNCTVTVTWDRTSLPDETRETQMITWRNYPYLRAETEVSSANIRPGDTFDVTIRLIGDGFELTEHLPVDVVLLLDRGEDMLLSENGQDRMEIAREAAEYLLEGGDYTGLTPGYDHVAYIPYGDRTDDPPFTNNTANILRTADGGPLDTTYQWSKDVGKDGNGNDDAEYIDTYWGNGNNTKYLDYAEVRLPYNPLIGSWADYHNELWKTVPLKKDKTGQASAPLRKGLYEAIKYMGANTDHSDPERVKVIVLLMQNNYRYFGDPFAEGGVMTVANDSNTLPKGGSEYYPFGLNPAHENMVTYAIANDITIYAIYYPAGGSQSDEEVPRRLAEETGGEYYFAADKDALIDAFNDIREKIMIEAGVNTEMDIKLINNVEALNWTADQILTYVPYNPNSTSIDWYNWTSDPYNSELGLQHEGYPKWENRTSDWLDDKNFYYEVGNITIKETWVTTFTMRVNASISETLNFSLFDDDSNIRFSNPEGDILLSLPTQHLTVSPNLTADVTAAAILELSNLREIVQTPEYREFAWDLNYTGEGYLVERIEYRPEDGGYILAGWNTVPCSTTSDSIKIMTENLPRMDYYLRVTVNSDDAGVRKAILLFSLAEPEKPYIKIE